MDERFKTVDEYGVYWAHQPIYGFRVGHSESGLFDKYSRTYEIMRMLSQMRFKTLLDVGGAEGYKASLVKELFNVNVMSSDLSEEACKRAKEIFRIESTVVDIHELPFKNDEFDVVLCSETLEHVKDLDRAVSELLRVARKAVLITVPHEPREVIEKHIQDEEIHSHIHAFDLESFSFLKSSGYDVISKKIMSQFSVDIAAKIIDRELMPKNIEMARPFKKVLLSIANLFLQIANRILNKRTAALIIQLDSMVSSFTDSYNAILFTILKDKGCLEEKQTRHISAYQIVNFRRPLYYLKTEETDKTSCNNDDYGADFRKLELASKEQKTFFNQGLDNLSFFIDRLKIKNDSLEMNGWAHISGKDSENSKIYVVLQSSQKTYICTASSQYRPDVTAFFKNLNLDFSGFRIRASTENLQKGKYRIGLYIERDCCDRGFRFTDKSLLVGGRREQV